MKKVKEEESEWNLGKKKIWETLTREVLVRCEGQKLLEDTINTNEL